VVRKAEHVILLEKSSRSISGFADRTGQRAPRQPVIGGCVAVEDAPVTTISLGETVVLEPGGRVEIVGPGGRTWLVIVEKDCTTRIRTNDNWNLLSQADTEQAHTSRSSIPCLERTRA
jgi:hypothetical protein